MCVISLFIGVFGHGFVVNNNGFILLHPSFKDQEGYLPIPPNVFLEDLEHSVNTSESLELKRMMIRRSKNESEFEVWQK